MVERVVAVRSVVFQTAGIVGPLIAGALFAFNRSLPFLLAVVGFVLAIVLLQFVPATGVKRLATDGGPAQALRDAVDGLRFIRRTPVLFGAISLGGAATGHRQEPAWC
jgi:hypothetical protein